MLVIRGRGNASRDGVTGVFGGTAVLGEASSSDSDALAISSASLKLTDLVRAPFAKASSFVWTTTHEEPHALSGEHTFTVELDFKIDFGFVVRLGLKSGDGPGVGRGRIGFFSGTSGLELKRLFISLRSSATLTSIVSRRL